MMRTVVLESAAPYINPTAITYPADWPDWDNRDDIAATSILNDGEGDDAGPSTLFNTLDLTPRKPETAEDKILAALDQLADPLGLQVNYADKDMLRALTGLEESTLDNTLSRLVKADRIHRPLDDRGKEIRGRYGPGPRPEPADD